MLQRYNHRQQGCQKKVFIRDFTYNLPQQFAKSHIFVLPSLSESFSMVLAEAMALGLPVVALRDCPGPANLITDEKNGLLAKSPENLANILVRLMRDGKLRCRLGKWVELL